MKLKARNLKHPSGIELVTPLFVPSYSSKGFALVPKKGGKLQSEVCQAIIIAKEMLVESQLVSAYDLHYEYLLDPPDFISTELTFIDSGGYETSSSFDLSETRRCNTEHEEWNIDLLNKVIEEWQYERFPAVIVSFDDETQRKSIKEQIDEASCFFLKHKDYLHDFLIKPETLDEKYIQIDSLLSFIGDLKEFHIIGITEKELGKSIFERMIRINKIRSSLDSHKINAPIHIFGSLDPISVILYFLAGAEIFDGLTWLKYSYFQGVAMYTNNLCAMDENIQITATDSQVKARSITTNIYYLDRLKNALVEFRNSNNFNVFDDLYHGLGSIIEKNYLIYNNRKKK